MKEPTPFLSDQELQDFLDSVGVHPIKDAINDNDFLEKKPPLPRINPSRYESKKSPTRSGSLWVALSVLITFVLGTTCGYFLGARSFSTYARYQGLAERLEALAETLTPVSVEHQVDDLPKNERIEPTDPIPPLTEEEQLAPKQPA